jgi:hypothetical protein
MSFESLRIGLSGGAWLCGLPPVWERFPRAWFRLRSLGVAVPPGGRGGGDGGPSRHLPDGALPRCCLLWRWHWSKFKQSTKGQVTSLPAAAPPTTSLGAGRDWQQSAGRGGWTNNSPGTALSCPEIPALPSLPAFAPLATTLAAAGAQQARHAGGQVRQQHVPRGRGCRLAGRWGWGWGRRHLWSLPFCLRT